MALELSASKVGLTDKGSGPFSLPFKQQVDYFKAKVNLPSNAWDDVLGAAHDRAFVVAGVLKADMLDDFRREIDLAITEGKAFTAFQKEFDAIVKKYGWEYNGSRDWRSRVIYSTNMNASYNAGRYAQLTEPSMLESHPFWRYRHNHGPNPRLPHLSWDGTTLPAGHPWFSSHFTPNGWNCHCRIEAVTADDAQVTPVPNDGVYTHIDSRGVAHVLPTGIDYGWNHAPGQSVGASFSTLVADKLIRLDATLGVALMQYLAPVMGTK